VSKKHFNKEHEIIQQHELPRLEVPNKFVTYGEQNPEHSGWYEYDVDRRALGETMGARQRKSDVSNCLINGECTTSVVLTYTSAKVL